MSDSKSAAALRRVLISFKASDVPGRADGADGVVELDSEVSAIDAAKTLWEHNILGAPVWDKGKEKYVGFFDMRDTLSAVVACASAVSEDEDLHHRDDDDDDDDRSHAIMSKYNTHMVKELSNLGPGDSSSDIPRVSYLAARNPFHYCGPSSTLEDCCRVLVARRIHRVPIVNGDGSGKCEAIVSQSALVSFLSTRVAKDDLKETLGEAGLDYKKGVVSVVDSAPAAEAFRLLDSHRLSGIAVVDEDGKLVGNTSARDIKIAAMDEGRTSIDTDILSYLATVRQAQKTKKERYPSCHVHEDSTVAHVVNLLAKTGYHRVFVVDEEIKPVGVISVADILKFAIGDN